MKPNLFHYISKSLADSFPILPRIRRSFIGLLFFCILALAVDLTEGEGLTIAIKPLKNGPYQNQPVTNYAAGTVHLQGSFTIYHPTIAQKFLFPGSLSGLDFGTLLFMMTVCILILLIVPKLQQQYIFRKDISHFIRILGYLMMLHGVFSIFRTVGYIPNEIERLTNAEFTSQHDFPILIWAELYVSLLVISLAGFYKKGIQLQEEQDLTV